MTTMCAAKLWNFDLIELNVTHHAFYVWTCKQSVFVGAMRFVEHRLNL